MKDAIGPYWQGFDSRLVALIEFVGDHHAYRETLIHPNLENSRVQPRPDYFAHPLWFHA
jgi:hypothetical protein